MKYSVYPSYKESGVEWLGEVPEGWGTSRLKFLCKITTGGKDTENKVDNGDYPFYVRSQTVERINSYSFNGEAILTAGDGVGVGKVFHYTNGKFDFHQRVYLFYRFKKIVGRFLFEYIKNNFHKVALAGEAKSTVDSLRLPLIQNFTITLPPLQEQKIIANYLDKATTKIDTLIEKQTKLIELLKEKRQAVISSAVTRGLDASVPMKDSGVEWLGEIPEKWSVKKLRHIGLLQNGISRGSEYFGSGYPFVNYGDIYNNFSLPKSVKGKAQSLKEDRRIYSVKKGDIFFTRTSETIDDIGMASTCINTIEDAVFSGFVIRFRQLSLKIDANYSKFYFRTGYSQSFFEKGLNLVTRASLGQDTLKLLPALIPPIEEQKMIATYLNDKTVKIDNLITKSIQAIALLKEKRTALISAAVAGKIDVRDAA